MLKTRIIKNLLIVITMYFIGFGNILGAPSLTSLFEITQPNGTKFRAYLRGDEFFSWWESEKGTILFRNMESGYFEYAKISFIEDKEQLVSTGVAFVAGEDKSIPSALILNMTKLNLVKIWRQKREDARKHLQGILEKQRESVNQ